MFRWVRLEVCLVDEGWMSVSFKDVKAIRVAANPGDDGLTLTLIGVCDERPNQVETSILDVAERHRWLLNDEEVGTGPREHEDRGRVTAR